MANRFLREQSGSALIEFTLIILLLLSVTFAIVDFGYAYWQWNSAEKATQLGVRMAAISGPVAGGFESYDCGGPGAIPGESCTSAFAVSFGTVTCDGAALSCTAPYNFSMSQADALVARMQQLFPAMTRDNLVVEYTDIGLGYVGRGSPVPAVTVRLVGLTFSFVFLEGLFGFGPIAMPDFRATLTAEDLRNGPPVSF
jgi:hypothetical protein